MPKSDEFQPKDREKSMRRTSRGERKPGTPETAGPSFPFPASIAMPDEPAVCGVVALNYPEFTWKGEARNQVKRQRQSCRSKSHIHGGCFRFGPAALIKGGGAPGPVERLKCRRIYFHARFLNTSSTDLNNCASLIGLIMIPAGPVSLRRFSICVSELPLI